MKKEKITEIVEIECQECGIEHTFAIGLDQKKNIIINELTWFDIDSDKVNYPHSDRVEFDDIPREPHQCHKFRCMEGLNDRTGELRGKFDTGNGFVNKERIKQDTEDGVLNHGWIWQAKKIPDPCPDVGE
jgi:hypothetical protein